MTNTNPFEVAQEVSDRADHLSNVVARLIYNHLDTLAEEDRVPYLKEIGDTVFGLVFEGGLEGAQERAP